MRAYKYNSYSIRRPGIHKRRICFSTSPTPFSLSLSRARTRGLCIRVADNFVFRIFTLKNNLFRAGVVT